MVRHLGLALLAGTALGGTAAHAKSDILPYVELDQVVDADLNNGGDVVTYTTLAAGVDGTIQSNRTVATFSYRYERRIPWESGYGDQDVHSGIARVRTELVPNMLSLEGGAIATRARTDIRGAVPSPLSLREDNLTQFFGGYVGPSFQHRFGELDVNASYQFSYVTADDNGSFRLPAGQPRLDTFDDATAHTLLGGIGMRPNNSLTPFGWNVSAGWQHENAGQLDNRFDSRFVRLELTQPVSPELALTAGVGYEDIEVGQRAPLIGANGQPVIDDNGHFVADPALPRILSYDTDGLTYDVGVLWRPDRRTEGKLLVGKRYGGTLVLGTLEYQMSERSGVSIAVYNGIESFGRSLTAGLASLPTSFEFVNPNQGQGLGGCVFGSNPGSGGCLDRSFQSITAANYRSRGVSVLYSAKEGPWTFGLGAGYAQRRYLAPVSATYFTLAGVKDQSAFVQANASRQLSPQSGVDATVYGSWYDSGIANSPEVYGAGASGSYYHNFGNRLTGRASVGLYTWDQDGFETDVNGQLLVGVRYTF